MSLKQCLLDRSLHKLNVTKYRALCRPFSLQYILFFPMYQVLSPLNSEIYKVSSLQVYLITIQFSVLTEAMLTAMNFPLTACELQAGRSTPLYLSSSAPPLPVSCLFCHPRVLLQKTFCQCSSSKLSYGDLYSKIFHFMKSMLKN